MDAEKAADLVASPHWEWARGMANEHGDIVSVLGSDGRPVEWVRPDGQRRFAVPIAGESLAIEHPGNHGHMLALVRKAWEPVGNGRPVEATVIPVCIYDYKVSGCPIPIYAVDVRVLCDVWRQEWVTPKSDYQPTRGLALAAALLAAPVPGPASETEAATDHVICPACGDRREISHEWISGHWDEGDRQPKRLFFLCGSDHCDEGFDVLVAAPVKAGEP
jgi:hypothetical protein